MGDAAAALAFTNPPAAQDSAARSGAGAPPSGESLSPRTWRVPPSASTRSTRGACEGKRRGVRRKSPATASAKGCAVAPPAGGSAAAETVTVYAPERPSAATRSTVFAASLSPGARPFTARAPPGPSTLRSRSRSSSSPGASYHASATRNAPSTSKGP